MKKTVFDIICEFSGIPKKKMDSVQFQLEENSIVFGKIETEHWVPKM